MSAGGVAALEYACCCNSPQEPPPPPGPLTICLPNVLNPGTGAFQTEANNVLSCSVTTARHVTQGIWRDQLVGATWTIQQNLIPPGTVLNLPAVTGLARTLAAPIPGSPQGISWNSPVFAPGAQPIYTSPVFQFGGQGRIVIFWLHQVTINEIQPGYLFGGASDFGCASYAGGGLGTSWTYGGTGIRFKIGATVFPFVSGVYISAFDSAPGLPIGGPSFPSAGGHTFNIDMFRCCEARIFHGASTPPNQLAQIATWTGIEGPYTYASCGFGQPVVTEYAYNFSGAFIPDPFLPCSAPQTNPPATYPPRGKYWTNGLWSTTASPPGTPVPTTRPLNYAVVT